MVNAQSYVVEMLNLEVSEEVNAKLVKAEIKLASAIIGKKKVREKVDTIKKILTDANVEYNTDEFDACITNYRKQVRETGGEFSTTKRKVVDIDINPDAFKECGLDIEIDLEDELHDFSEDTLEEIDNTSIEAIEDQTSVTVHQFALGVINEEFLHECIEATSKLEGEDLNISNFIYWALRGKVSIDETYKAIVGMLEETNIIKSAMILRLIKKPLAKVIKSLDKSILELSEISNSDDLELVEETFNKCVDRVMKHLEFLTVFLDKDIEDYVKFILLASLDSFICAEICGLKEIQSIDEKEVAEVMNNIKTFIESTEAIEDLNIDSVPNVFNVIRQKSESTVSSDPTEVKIKTEKESVSKNETTKVTTKSTKEPIGYLARFNNFSGLCAH